MQADGREPAHRERLEIQEREGLIQEQSSRGERRAVPAKSEDEGRAQVRTPVVYQSQDPGGLAVGCGYPA